MRDLYEPRNSKYSYEDSEVLINYLDIHNTKDLLYYEAKITAAKSLGLRQRGITGNFDKKDKDYGMYEFKKGFNARVIELIGELELPITYHYQIHQLLSSLKQIWKGKK